LSVLATDGGKEGGKKKEGSLPALHVDHPRGGKRKGIKEEDSISPSPFIGEEGKEGGGIEILFGPRSRKEGGGNEKKEREKREVPFGTLLNGKEKKKKRGRRKGDI